MKGFNVKGFKAANKSLAWIFYFGQAFARMIKTAHGSNWTPHWLCDCIDSVVEFKLNSAKLLALILLGHDTSKTRSDENEITRGGRDIIQTGERLMSHLVFFYLYFFDIVIFVTLFDCNIYDFLESCKIHNDMLAVEIFGPY